MKHLFDYTKNPSAKDIERMIRDGANVNSQDGKGRTSFMMAACYGFEDCARALIAGGANPDIQDNQGNTALILAAYAGQASAVGLIVELGGDPSLKDHDGLTALEAAESNPSIPEKSLDRIRETFAGKGIEIKRDYIKTIRIPSVIQR